MKCGLGQEFGPKMDKVWKDRKGVFHMKQITGATIEVEKCQGRFQMNHMW